MISHSTSLKPGTSRGRSASVTGRVSSSFKHGIWMMSFIVGRIDGIALVILSSLMEGATLSRRPALARVRSLDADTIARIAFALLCVATAIGFFVYPTYPNYDSYYSLLWGREVLDFQLPGFEGFRVPTEHPLAIVAGMVFSPLPGGDRLFIAAILASFLWLIWGVYRLGRTAFTPLVGGVAALLTLTRFDFGFLAARGYIDIPYMAIVVWAAALEAARPRRGVPVLLLLAAAGLLRPEAWVLSGLYWLWLAWRGDVEGPRAVRRARRHRAGRLDGHRSDRHRRPAVLAPAHEQLGRGPRPPAHAVRAPDGDPRLLQRAREAAGRAGGRCSGWGSRWRSRRAGR